MLILILYSVYAQYIPIPLNNTSKWYVADQVSHTNTTPDTLVPLDFMKYYIYNDTIINNTNYKKLYRKIYFTDANIYWGSDPVGQYLVPPHTGYVGAIRQDSITQKIYFVPINMEQEVLLYDFSLHNSGDIINVWTGEKAVNKYIPMYTTPSQDTCGQVWSYAYCFQQFLASSKFISKNGREHYWQMQNNYTLPISGNDYKLVHCWFDSYWIEGVGSKSGILEHLMNNTSTPVQPYSSQLLCFEADGKVKYPFSDTTKCCCDSVIRIKECGWIDDQWYYCNYVNLKTTKPVNNEFSKKMIKLHQNILSNYPNDYLIIGYFKNGEVKEYTIRNFQNELPQIFRELKVYEILNEKSELVKFHNIIK